jgi:membrane dipeptidase
VERGYQIEDDLDKLGAFYKIGVRYVTLTWNYSTSCATITAEETFTKDLKKQRLDWFWIKTFAT